MADIKKGKSETRKKSLVIGVRVTENEKAEIEAKAERLNISAPAFLRRSALENQETEEIKTASFDIIILSKLLAELGKCGSNLNQIARRLNAGKGVALPRIIKGIDGLMILKEKLLKELNNDSEGRTT